MPKFKIGAEVTKRLPWVVGAQKCRIEAKRIPLEGEYIMDSRGNVYRRGGPYMSSAQAKKEYFILKPVY